MLKITNIKRKTKTMKSMKNNIVVLASNNKKKIFEIETLLSENPSIDLKVSSLRDIGFNDEIVEYGITFEENALIKASVPAKLGYFGIADDSGLMVDHLDGAPGVYSARFAGEPCDDSKNRMKLLECMQGVQHDFRKAKFVCTMALVLPEESNLRIPEEWQITEEASDFLGIRRDHAMVVRGECHGYIATEETGSNGFGYDSLFYYPEFDKTFAELTNEQKNSVSHRGKAIREFIKKMISVFEGE